MLNSQPVNSSPNYSLPESLAVKIGWTILIIVTLAVCYFSHLGAIGFVGPDEPRYAWIARAMYETGDWVTPRLYGQPWFEKPVLYYWGAAASFKLFGVSEAAARLPSALSALLATLALAWLALRLYGKETARWLLLLLPTSVGMIGFSHAASTDMPFSGMLTIAMVCAAVVLRLTRNEHSPVIERTPWLTLIGFGFFLGTAVLAKGPAAIILSGGAIFLWALLTRRWRDAFRLFHPAALLTFFATALPWYILCARRNPTFFHVFIIEHNFNRYLTPEFQHLQPFWFFIPVIVVALAPWTFALALFLGDFCKTLRTPKNALHSQLFIFFWAVFPFLFFSISKAKLPGYILPSVAPFVLMIAISVATQVEKREPARLWIGWTTAGSLLFLLVAAKLATGRMNFSLMRDDDLPVPIGPVFAFCTVLIGSLAAIGICVVMRNLKVTMAVNSIVVTIAVFTVLLPAPTSSGGKSAFDFLAARSLAIPPPGVSLLEWSSNVSFYKLHRSSQYAVNYYLHFELPEWDGDATKKQWVLTDYKNEPELRAKGLDCPLPYRQVPSAVACSTQNTTAQPSR